MSTEETVTLEYDGKSYELPLLYSSEGLAGIDVTQLRATSGMITFDPGYGNTASCDSAITYVDGDKGILRYRGYDIEELAENSTFIEVALLLIFGELPSSEDITSFRATLSEQELLHEDLLHHFEGFPPNGAPMAILSALINSMGSYHEDLLEIESEDEFKRAVAKIISKIRTIAAFSHRKSRGLPFIYPDPNLSFCRNFMHMMFSIPYRRFETTPEMVRALSRFLIVHADHGQNTSTSAVRMVGSTQANLFASVASGICALWGPLQGGVSWKVNQTLESVRKGETSVEDIIFGVKAKRFKLMGFGHRIYKVRDPRATIMRKIAEELALSRQGEWRDLLNIAVELEEKALQDDYFVSRRLFPNLDFYSGLILKALGIPPNMYPVMIALGNVAGWIAQWYEQFEEPQGRIHRPRQIYMGLNERGYVPESER